MASEHILIVDDEPAIRSTLRDVLEDEGYRVSAVGSGADALRFFADELPELTFLDIWMDRMDGLETLAEIRRARPVAVVVMISGHGTIETAVKATRLGAYDFVEKPLSLEKILVTVSRALEHARLERENAALRAGFEQRAEIVGESAAMRALREQIATAAPTTGRVLIHGENGSGKELVARAIHVRSARRERSFVEVNCAAIPEELIESELFGHEKGAFTGALARRRGKFELADGGTLFLDEIGDMSLKTQAKVLRALEEQSFKPIGAPVGVRVDVRVITATNKNLQSEIAAGRFREDLFYRLNVIPFFVSPLRERREDIPILAQYFTRVFSAEHGRGPKEFTADALDLLIDYSWPGNVRELRNEIERLVIMAPDAVIQAEDLSLPNGNSGSRASTLHEARAQYEREFILSKLKENNWNISQTARLLGLERSYLYRKMKAYGIEK